MRKSALLLAAIFGLSAPWAAGVAADTRIAVVAAENFYGDVAQQIGGENVAVDSILGNPDQDPHLFETSPSIIRRIAQARVVVFNGAAYDPWMERLIAVAPKADRTAIVAADLMHRSAGDDPHLWYDPQTIPAVAAALAGAFAGIDPAHKDAYAARLKVFLDSLAPVEKKIADIRAKYAGSTVTATEPVFGHMASALGLAMRNSRLQLAIMNDTEPSSRDVADFEHDLKAHRVRVMFYNKQATNRMVQHLADLARAEKIPVVGVTETCPPGLSYQDWMLRQLEETERALNGQTS